MSRLSAISFAMNLAAFVLLLALAALALIAPALDSADDVLHDTYHFVPDPSITALFGGAMALLSAGLIVQIRTLKKGDQ
ncbi:MAG: hypothetical protein ACKOED_12855 [Aestuariivirga sp.]|uniref:hypothetical protein n=1 Tax=Aestuariivirga sp. TaxID=2650926 RepID=UPI0038D087C6